MSKTTIRCVRSEDNHEYHFVNEYGGKLAVITVFCNGYVSADIHAKDTKARVLHLEWYDGGPHMMAPAKLLDLGSKDSYKRIVCFDFNSPKKDTGSDLGGNP